jgi:hypothetical protein
MRITIFIRDQNNTYNNNTVYFVLRVHSLSTHDRAKIKKDVLLIEYNDIGIKFIHRKIIQKSEFEWRSGY